MQNLTLPLRHTCWHVVLQRQRRCLTLHVMHECLASCEAQRVAADRGGFEPCRRRDAQAAPAAAADAGRHGAAPTAYIISSATNQSRPQNMHRVKLRRCEASVAHGDDIIIPS